MLDGVTANLTGVADVSVRPILQLALGARTGGQLDEAWRMGTRVGLRHEPCVGDTLFVDDWPSTGCGDTGFGRYIRMQGGAVLTLRQGQTFVAVWAAVVYRDVSGNREATVVELVGRMATVLMGGEQVLGRDGSDP